MKTPFRKKAEKINDDSVTGIELVNEIELSLIAAYNAGLKKAEKETNWWLGFYRRMQDKSKPNEKDGLFRALAAEDILGTILQLKIKGKK